MPNQTKWPCPHCETGLQKSPIDGLFRCPKCMHAASASKTIGDFQTGIESVLSTAGDTSNTAFWGELSPEEVYQAVLDLIGAVPQKLPASVLEAHRKTLEEVVKDVRTRANLPKPARVLDLNILGFILGSGGGRRRDSKPRAPKPAHPHELA